MKPLRPYLYHAYYHWLLDNDMTPYLLVNALYPHVKVPTEFVREGKIILNISPRSIGQYIVDDEGIRFNARFQGVLKDLIIPFGSMEAIYSQETSDGVMFQEESYYATGKDSPNAHPNHPEHLGSSQQISKPKSHLKRVK